MCGFAGEFVFAGRADLGLAQAMAAKLAHRGPDEERSSISTDGRCAIGFRRLAVIDPPGSHQPMSLPDGAATVAFNGEIYNYAQLRVDLIKSGFVFHTAGDTEVLLHLYQLHGQDMLNMLTGMFAFVIYDVTNGRLMMARDRLGQKPLWYARLKDRLVFASEAKAILQHPLVPRGIDECAITQYLSIVYIPAPSTIWRSIRKLQPGHSLLTDGRQDSLNRYWQPKIQPQNITRPELVDAVRQAVTDAVKSQMVSDVPLGALLSGGIDSAIVVANMAANAGKAGGVRTFTAGFEDGAFDERTAARLVADHCRTEHTELLIRPNAASALDELVKIFDEPFADSSALPTWLICRAARQHVTVALSGDGGDECFAGYDRYRAVHLASRLSPPGYLAARVVGSLLRPFAPKEERSRLRRIVRFANNLIYPLAKQYFMYRKLFSSQEFGRLLTPEFASRIDVSGPEEWFCDLYESPDVDDEVTRAQLHDIATYLPDDLLVKVDMASMVNSLEVRSPMLDHRVVELGLALPLELKLNRRVGKLALREAFKDKIPPAILKGPKRGFGVPLGRWLREDLADTVRQTLLDPSVARAGILNSQAVEGLVNDHLDGVDDHRHRLWALLVLVRWLAENR